MRELTELDMVKLRNAVSCDHELATLVSENEIRKVVQCPTCGCRITSFKTPAPTEPPHA